MARRMNGESFWHGLEQLVADHRLVVDRPRGAPMNVHRAYLGGRPAVDPRVRGGDDRRGMTERNGRGMSRPYGGNDAASVVSAQVVTPMNVRREGL
jgi:hypothetical protein